MDMDAAVSLFGIETAMTYTYRSLLWVTDYVVGSNENKMERENEIRVRRFN